MKKKLKIQDNDDSMYIYYDDEEKEIVEAYEEGKVTLLSKKELEKEKKKLKEAVLYTQTLRKNKNVNFRIALGNLIELKKIAANEGIPYQTLTASIIHKFIRDYKWK